MFGAMVPSGAATDAPQPDRGSSRSAGHLAVHTRNRKLTMLIPATSKNVAPPYCSDEREVKSQKAERGIGGVAKF
jgi:hypothetical protein